MGHNDMRVFSTGLVLLIYLGGLPCYFKYLRGHPRAAVSAWLPALVIGMWKWRGLLELIAPSYYGNNNTPVADRLVWAAATVMLPLFAAPLLMKLYFKWLCGELTPEENALGAAGARAWLRGGNAICCAGISFCAWQGYGFPLWGIVTLTLLSLLGFPLINTLAQNEPALAPRTDDLSSERERVLKLLENGKITADESAELLAALGSTVRPAPSRGGGLPMVRKSILLGGALLLLGFFLPWFAMNPGNEVNRFADQFQRAVPGLAGMNPNLKLPFEFNTGTVRISGGDLSHGIGWLILLLGLGAAALPFLGVQLEPMSQTTISLVALAVGGIALLYLASQNFRFVSLGLMLTVVAYGILAAATLKERQSQLAS
jgi:hypothetical protein